MHHFIPGSLRASVLLLVLPAILLVVPGARASDDVIRPTGRIYYDFARFDNDDRGDHDQTDRENDGENGKEIEAEAAGDHHDGGTDQRDWHRDKRNQSGAHRTHEEEDNDGDDEARNLTSSVDVDVDPTFTSSCTSTSTQSEKEENQSRRR